MPGTLRLQLLGGFALRAEDDTTLLAGGKALAVLAYLAASRDRQSSRQALTDLLWPEQDREKARSSLRQALFVLRRLVGPETLAGEGEWLTLAPVLATDLELFQGALRRGAMQEAVSLYGGPFIPDDGVVASRYFEQWVAAERFRLQSAFNTAARTHYRDLMDRGDLPEAIVIATRLRDAAPEADDSWHLLLTSLAVANQYAAMELEVAALRAVRTATESDIDETTEALLKRLRRQRHTQTNDEPQSSERSAVPVHPEFQGRAGLLRELSSAWHQAQRGEARTLIIEAAPGFGKTRVLQELGRRLRLERARVVTCTASYREQDDEYAIIAELAGQLARLPGAAGISRASAMVLARLTPELADAFKVPAESPAQDPAERLRHRTNAFADLCAAVADEAPVVLLIDDLQWAHAASCHCLARTLDRLSPKRLLLVAASRTGSTLLGPTIPLHPLTPDDVMSLLASLAIVEPSVWTVARTEQLTRLCGGSPFRILQGLRSAIAGGALAVTSNRWEVVDWDRCSTLLNPTVSMHERFAKLSPLEQRVIATLTAIERPVSVSALGEALTVGSVDVLQALRHLDHEGFVSHSADEAWTLAHALVAEETSQLLPLDLRQDCSARLGRHLARAVEDAQGMRDTVHLLLGGGELLAALEVVDRFLQTSRYQYDAQTLAQMVAGLRGDAVFTRHVRELLARRRRQGIVSILLRAAVILVCLIGMGAGILAWRNQASHAVAQAPAPPALIPNGLHAYFPLDGTAENRIDRGASGTPISVHWVADRKGVRAHAAYFDRIAFVELPPSVFDDLPNGTIALWVSWSGSGGLQALTSKQRDNDNSWGILSISGFAGQGGQPTKGDSGRVYYHGSHEHMTGRANVLRSETVLVPNRWYHVAVTWNDRVMQLFINGRVESTVDCVRCDIAPNRAPDVHSRIGDWIPDNQRFRFGGTLDELRVYNRVLSSDEIIALQRG